MYQRLRNIFQRSYLAGVIFILISFIPSPAFADSSSTGGQTDPSSDTSSSSADTTASANPLSSDDTSAPTTSTTPSSNATPAASSNTSSSPSTSSSSTNQTGPTSPTGAAAKTYTYDPTTGLWSNQYYTWNPATGQTTPNTSQTYSYNPSTGMWDTTQWAYSATTGTYVPNVVAVTTVPNNAVVTSPEPAATADTNNASAGTPLTTSTNASDGAYDNFYNAAISNNINSTAQTGDTLVMGNTTGGSSTSGNATDLADVINLLQSTAGLGTSGLNTFVANVNGDVNGDLLIDPRLLQSTTNPNAVATNVEVNNATNGQINNNVALTAGSGDATVADNTTGGDATSGNADAVANIVNLIDSAISSNQSFLGVVNIYGNLTGNILVPSDLLNSLLATNSATSATPTNATTTVNNTDNSAINNDVTTTAQTGQASVTGNTSAGDATSGNAATNVTVFNLTGSQIVASNSLLVFVNVLGQWVGFIMNAPAGTTAAALGGGVTSDTTGVATGNTTANNNSNEAINNDVNVGSQSGNATVANNTTAGNATSGNATSSVNLLNIDDSSLSLSNWFGILFINVFGNWFGSLESSNDAPATNSNIGSTDTTTSSTVPNGVKGVAIFHITPTNKDSTYSISSIASALSGTGSNGSTPSTQGKTQTTLVSYTSKPGTIIHANTPASSFHLNVLPFIVGIFGISALGIEQFRSISRRRARNAVSAVMLSKLNDE
jgi:hypothetical protein